MAEGKVPKIYGPLPNVAAKTHTPQRLPHKVAKKLKEPITTERTRSFMNFWSQKAISHRDSHYTDKSAQGCVETNPTSNLAKKSVTLDKDIQEKSPELPMLSHGNGRGFTHGCNGTASSLAGDQFRAISQGAPNLSTTCSTADLASSKDRRAVGQRAAGQCGMVTESKSDSTTLYDRIYHHDSFRLLYLGLLGGGLCP